MGVVTRVRVWADRLRKSRGKMVRFNVKSIPPAFVDLCKTEFDSVPPVRYAVEADSGGGVRLSGREKFAADATKPLPSVR